MKYMPSKMSPGRKVVFRAISPLLHQEGIRLSASLERFLAAEEPWYPKLVAEFYRNLRRSCSMDNDNTTADAIVVSSTVGGVHIRIDERTLGAITGLPPCGLDLHPASWMAPVRGEATILIRLTGSKTVAQGADGSPNRRSWRRMRYLTPAARILAHIVVHDLMPRTDWHNDLTLTLARAIYALMEGMEVNWPRVFLNRMAEAVPLKRSLPYGMMLTKVFRHFSLPLSGKVEGVKPSKMDERSLYWMGLLPSAGQAVNQEKGVGEEREIREEGRGQEKEQKEETSSGIDGEGVTEPAAGARFSSTSDIHDLHRFMAEICDNYTEFRFKVLGLRDKMAALGNMFEHRMADVERRQSELQDRIKRQFPQPLAPQKS